MKKLTFPYPLCAIIPNAKSYSNHIPAIGITIMALSNNRIHAITWLFPAEYFILN